MAVDDSRTRSRHQRRGLKLTATVGFVGALAVVAAACGGGGSSHSATKGQTSGTTGAPPTTMAPSSTMAPSTTMPTKSKAAGSSSTKASVVLQSSSQFGKYLTTPAGYALYTYTADKPGGKGCTGQCLKIWPPLLLAPGQTTPMAAHGISGLGTFHRGSRLQVTYRGLPLYTYIEDKSPGQTTGQQVVDSGGTWYVAALSGQPKSAGKSTSSTTAPSSGGAAF